MKFSIRSASPEKAKTGCLVLGVHGSALGRAARVADRAARGLLRRAIGAGDLPTRAGATLLLHRPPGLGAERVLLVSLGERTEYGVGKMREALRGAAAVLRELGAADAVLAIEDFAVRGRGLADAVRQAVWVVREAFYRFDELKTEKKPPAPRLGALALALGGATVPRPVQEALAEAIASADGADLARRLGNLPANLLTPARLAEEARALARRYRLGLRVLERRDMERLGMGALLAVARGSRQPPKLIVLHHDGARRNAKPLVLVGKGITFDTGGISLKPAAEMDEMKFDMSGAGAVLGTIHALAALRAPVNVVGVIPACENMPGGEATRPGDVVKTMSGQTVEILNTDAEGRLILCDALTYAERFAPAAVVDVATLTGACVIALGHVASGLFANDDRLADSIRRAADEVWDRVWRMPLWEDYQEQLRSNFADVANVGGRPAGAVTAACFLSRFAKKFRWAHLDIAGTAWKSGREKGSTGRPVPLLVRFALEHAARA